MPAPTRPRIRPAERAAGVNPVQGSGRSGEETRVGFVVVRGTQEKVRVGKIVAAGQNYADHTKEMGSSPVKDPILFLKPSTAIIHEGEPIVFPRRGELLHHEVELGVVIGKDCSDVETANAGACMLGYVLALDLTLRDRSSSVLQHYRHVRDR